jgi:hypothetical protein
MDRVAAPTKPSAVKKRRRKLHKRLPPDIVDKLCEPNSPYPYSAEELTAVTSALPPLPDKLRGRLLWRVINVGKVFVGLSKPVSENPRKELETLLKAMGTVEAAISGLGQAAQEHLKVITSHLSSLMTIMKPMKPGQGRA